MIKTINTERVNGKDIRKKIDLDRVDHFEATGITITYVMTSGVAKRIDNKPENRIILRELYAEKEKAIINSINGKLKFREELLYKLKRNLAFFVPLLLITILSSFFLPASSIFFIISSVLSAIPGAFSLGNHLLIKKVTKSCERAILIKELHNKKKDLRASWNEDLINTDKLMNMFSKSTRNIFSNYLPIRNPETDEDNFEKGIKDHVDFGYAFHIKSLPELKKYFSVFGGINITFLKWKDDNGNTHLGYKTRAVNKEIPLAHNYNQIIRDRVHSKYYDERNKHYTITTQNEQQPRIKFLGIGSLSYAITKAKNRFLKVHRISFKRSGQSFGENGDVPRLGGTNHTRLRKRVQVE